VGALSLGFINAAIYSLLPEVLRTFRTRFPQVALTLHELTTEDQIMDLLEGRIDVGFLRPPIRADNLNSMVVLREPFVVALPEAHPLAEQPEIPLRELADAAFLMATRHHGPSLYDQIISLCQKAGFTPRVVQEADRMQTIVGLVAAGIGVALVPGSMQHLRRAGVVYRPIEPSDSALEIAIAWRKDDPSPCLRSLLEVIGETRATQSS
jgi:DNA-binding transcriptional LysR family regulator